MKILVVYATRGGLSRECAELLAAQLNQQDEVSLFSVENAPAPEGFDVAVVGGSVHFGAWNRKLKKYLKLHKAALSAMPCALFFCCGLALRYEEYAELEVPRGLTPSLGVHYFGGELKPQKRKGLDKLLVFFMRQSILTQDFETPDDTTQHSLPEMLPESVIRVADSIRRLR